MKRIILAIVMCGMMAGCSNKTSIEDRFIAIATSRSAEALKASERKNLFLAGALAGLKCSDSKLDSTVCLDTELEITKQEEPSLFK